MADSIEITDASDGDSRVAARAFGAYLRDLRKSHQLNQADLAQRIEVTSGYYGFFEQGRQIPSLKIINRLADVLGADYLEMAMKAGYDELEARKKEMYRPQNSSKAGDDEQAEEQSTKQQSEDKSLSEAGSGAAEVVNEATNPNSITFEENGVRDSRGVDQTSNFDLLLTSGSGANDAGLDQPRLDWAMGCISRDPVYKLSDQFRGEIPNNIKALVIQLYQAQTGRKILTADESASLNQVLHG